MMNITDINDNNSETSTESNETKFRVKTKGRPITLHWRFDENGVLVVKNPTTHDYKLNYYRDVSSCKIECPLCNRKVVSEQFKRHQRSNICLQIAYEKCCLESDY